MLSSKKLVLTSFFIACGLILPLAFHNFGMGGPIFLPMHFPVLLCGLLLGPRSGLLTGLLTPLISSLLTGMPAFLPTMPLMMGELAVYGLTAGYFYCQKRFPLLAALSLALIAGRIMTALLLLFLGNSLHIQLTPWAYVAAACMRGVLGILLQFLLIPPSVKILKKHLLTK